MAGRAPGGTTAPTTPTTGGDPRRAGGTTLQRTLRSFEHQVLLYRRTWRGSILGSFFAPVLFLLALGVGLGGYVDRSAGGVGGVPYLVYLAPGLLAANVMQTAASEGTFPIMGGFVWTRRYHAMHATPIESDDIALGHLLFVALRLTMVGMIFVAVMLAFGVVRSPAILLAIPAATLTGLAFNAPISAYAATRKTMQSFNYIFRFGITPLFLFSGTFFPVEQLPEFIRPLAWITPLYHGVALTRSLALGTAFDDPGAAAVHLGVLLLFTVAGVIATLLAFRRRLGT
jgi:lipooligosaccharide transport system permease protein